MVEDGSPIYRSLPGFFLIDTGVGWNSSVGFILRQVPLATLRTPIRGHPFGSAFSPLFHSRGPGIYSDSPNVARRDCSLPARASLVRTSSAIGDFEMRWAGAGSGIGARVRLPTV